MNIKDIQILKTHTSFIYQDQSNFMTILTLTNIIGDWRGFIFMLNQIFSPFRDQHLYADMIVFVADKLQFIIFKDIGQMLKTGIISEIKDILIKQMLNDYVQARKCQYC